MTPTIALRGVEDADLALFFEHQQDPDALWMAAFTAEDPADCDAFLAKWAKILADPGVTARTILVDGAVAGSVLVHGWFGEPEVTYWIGREYWGQGVASRALALLLAEVPARPLTARVAKDNLASRRVLERCGFTIAGEDKGFANARGQEIEETILTLQ